FGLSLPILALSYRGMCAEAAVAEAGLDPPGTSAPATAGDTMDELERTRAALGRAVKSRPDWAEAHWRLGLTDLRLYERSPAGATRRAATAGVPWGFPGPTGNRST